jgi:hypothetical protein
VAVADLRHNCYSVRYSLWHDLGTPSESLISAGVPTPEAAGVHRLTASVSAQNLCLEMPVAFAACARSPMYASVLVGWPTVWPTANRLPLSES